MPAAQEEFAPPIDNEYEPSLRGELAGRVLRHDDPHPLRARRRRAGRRATQLGDHDSIAWAWGLGVTLGIYVAGRLSGAHLNPAVTVALAAFQGFPWRKVVPYAIAQTAGAFVAALLVRWNYTEVLAKFDPGHTIKTQFVFSTLPGNGALPVQRARRAARPDHRHRDPGVPDLRDHRRAQLGAAGQPRRRSSSACSSSASAWRGAPTPATRSTRPATSARGWRRSSPATATPWRDQYGNLYFWVPIVGPLIGGLIGGALYTLRHDPLPPAGRGDRNPNEPEDAGNRPPHRAHRTGGTGMADFVGAIDQGTTSTRFMIFDHDGNEVGRHQLEHEQILPQAGWVEHDPVEIWERTDVGDRRRALEQGQPAGLRPRRARHHQPARDHRRVEQEHRPAVLQRDRLAGHPHRPHRQRARARRPRRRHPAARPACRRPRTSPAARSSGSSRTSTACARPPRRATPSSAPPTPGCCGTSPAAQRRRARHRRHQRQPHDADGPRDARLGRRAARASSASRARCCPRSSRRRTPNAYGDHADRPVRGTSRSPATSATSRRPWSARSASRPARPRTPTAPATSCCSTPAPSWSAASNGLLTTVCYQFGDDAPVYALEGSIAVTGSAVQWLRDQLGIISGAARDRGAGPAASTTTAASTSSRPSPACSRRTGARDARGAIVGLSRFNTNAHLARATLESICYQSRDVVRGDGGRLRRPRSRCSRSTAASPPTTCACRSRPTSSACRSAGRWSPRPPRSGAAYAAGLAVGFWNDTDELRENWNEIEALGARVVRRAARADGYAGWQKAVERTLDWVDVRLTGHRAPRR